jgi:hypothetical protein
MLCCALHALLTSLVIICWPLLVSSTSEFHTLSLCLQQPEADQLRAANLSEVYALGVPPR